MAGAHGPGVTIKFFSVIKGYHNYKIKMEHSKHYKCQQEPDNCIDKDAVVVKCLESGNTVGHVPSKPVKLNKKITRILQLDSTIEIYWYVLFI
jgi:hypothetical protein